MRQNLLLLVQYAYLKRIIEDNDISGKKGPIVINKDLYLP